MKQIKVKKIDLRPYFGLDSKSWPDEEEQYFVDYDYIYAYRNFIEGMEAFSKKFNQESIETRKKLI
jgi:hypothetical protein